MAAHNRLFWENSDFPVICKSSRVMVETPTVQCQKPIFVRRAKYVQSHSRYSHVDLIPMEATGQQQSVRDANRVSIDNQFPYGRAGYNTLPDLQRTRPYHRSNRPPVCMLCMRGECTGGAECPYRHKRPITGQNITDQCYQIPYGKVRCKQNLSEFPRTTPYQNRNGPPVCRLYARGECTSGAQCRYRHEMPNPQELSNNSIMRCPYGKQATMNPRPEGLLYNKHFGQPPLFDILANPTFDDFGFGIIFQKSTRMPFAFPRITKDLALSIAKDENLVFSP
ncbi:hypothetical protein IFM89_011297 [Coptis chinensis]|uniref:C3H1-type domain-containing protein n=1 Tax=Coptis chinensis TaxID=261450 RepID=A0A835LRL3_9MAGN|nr:hypothetical protein IFM89_011297 [Coptis chinensis]